MATVLTLEERSLSGCFQCRQPFRPEAIGNRVLQVNDPPAPPQFYHEACYQHAHATVLASRQNLFSKSCWQRLGETNQQRIRQALYTANHLDTVLKTAPHLLYDDVVLNAKSGTFSPATFLVDAVDRWPAAILTRMPFVPAVPATYFADAYGVIEIDCQSTSSLLGLKSRYTVDVAAVLATWKFTAADATELLIYQVKHKEAAVRLVVRLCGRGDDWAPGDLKEFGLIARPDGLRARTQLRERWLPAVMNSALDHIHSQILTSQCKLIKACILPRITARADVRRLGNDNRCLLLVNRQVVLPTEFADTYIFSDTEEDSSSSEQKSAVAAVKLWQPSGDQHKTLLPTVTSYTTLVPPERAIPCVLLACTR
jgi:hypothetical protein